LLHAREAPYICGAKPNNAIVYWLTASAKRSDTRRALQSIMRVLPCSTAWFLFEASAESADDE